MSKQSPALVQNIEWAVIMDVGFLAANSVPPTAEQFTDALNMLFRMGDAGQFGIGDAYIFGEATFGNQGIDVTQFFSGRRMSIKTVQNYAWVCRRIPYDERVPGVSFGHHSVVAKLARDERDAWLRRVKDEDMTVEELAGMTRSARDLADHKKQTPLEAVSYHYNSLLEAFQALPECDEKKTIRRALTIIEHAIKKLQGRTKGKKA